MKRYMGLLATLLIAMTASAQARTVYVNPTLFENPSFRPALQLASEAASLIGRGFTIRESATNTVASGNVIIVPHGTEVTMGNLRISGPREMLGPMVTIGTNVIFVDARYYKPQTNYTRKELYMTLLHELVHTYGVHGHVEHGIMSATPIPSRFTYFWDPPALMAMGYSSEQAKSLYERGNAQMQQRATDTGYVKRVGI